MSQSMIAFVLTLGACSSTVSESPAKPPTAPTGSSSDGTGATKPVPADAVACETDEDCNRHACGPCNAGDVLTTHDVTIKCLVNPCPKTTVSCKNKVCTVN